MARITLSKLNNINKLIKRDGELTPADTLLKDLDNFIIKQNSGEMKVSKSFKPSSMQCDRNMWYQIHGVNTKYESTSEGARITEVGSDSHERIQQYLLDMSKDSSSVWEYYDIEKYIKENNLENELEIIGKNGLETKIYNKKYNIRFQTDGILYNRITKLFYIFEFKTETDRKWSTRDGVDPKHYNQAYSYMASFHITTGTIFIYEGRDLLGHKAFFFKYNANEVNKLLNKLLDIIQKEKDGILPDKCGNAKICQYCPYINLCKFDLKGD